MDELLHILLVAWMVILLVAIGVVVVAGALVLGVFLLPIIIFLSIFA